MTTTTTPAAREAADLHGDELLSAFVQHNEEGAAGVEMDCDTAQALALAIRSLQERADKFMQQVRDTCVRAEKAEATLHAEQSSAGAGEAVARQDGGGEATGWLIEENASGIIHWITLERDSWPRTQFKTVRKYEDEDIDRVDTLTPVRRVKDSNEALRFARKEDAEAFIKLFDRFLLFPVATEHQWPLYATAPRTADDGVVEALGEALFKLSAKLLDANFFAKTDNHAAYEKVVSAWKGLADHATASGETR